MCKIIFRLGCKLSVYSALVLLLLIVVDFSAAHFWIERLNPHQPDKLFRVPDYKYHHKLKASFNGYHVWGGKISRFCTSSIHGNRTLCEANTDSRSNRKILVIGDSFVEGVGLEYESTFAHILDTHSPEEVVNLGVASYATPQYRDVIIDYVKTSTTEISTVIVFIDVSDVRDQAFFYNRRLDGSIMGPSDNFYKERVKRWLPLTTTLWSSLRRLLNDQPTVPYWVENIDNRWKWSVSKVDLFTDEGKKIERGKEKSLQDMRELSKYLDQNGIGLIVGIYPWPGHFVADAMDGNHQISIWEKFCKDNCDLFYNGFEWFQSSKLVGHYSADEFIRRYYQSGDNHLNELGNELLYQGFKDLGASN